MTLNTFSGKGPSQSQTFHNAHVLSSIKLGSLEHPCFELEKSVIISMSDYPKHILANISWDWNQIFLEMKLTFLSKSCMFVNTFPTTENMGSVIYCRLCRAVSWSRFVFGQLRLRIRFRLRLQLLKSSIYCTIFSSICTVYTPKQALNTGNCVSISLVKYFKV